MEGIKLAQLLDIIMVVCIIIMVIGGIAYLLLPSDKLVKQDKLKNGETYEDATKRIRKSGIFYIIFGALLFLFTFVI